MSEWDTDQQGLLPPSPYGIWVDTEGMFWIDTQDGTTHPFRVTQLGEVDEWRTLEEAAAAGLTALIPAAAE